MPDQPITSETKRALNNESAIPAESKSADAAMKKQKATVR
jgi:hypothetical protein